MPVGNPGHGWTHAQNVALISVFHNNWVNLALTKRNYLVSLPK
jgi:hypothetical protein